RRYGSTRQAQWRARSKFIAKCSLRTLMRRMLGTCWRSRCASRIGSNPARGEQKKGRRRGPKPRPICAPRGKTRRAAGPEQEAQSSFRRAVEINPGFTEAHYWLGRSCQREGKLADAIAAYREALRSAPQVAEIHYHHARALLWANRLREALQSYPAPLARYPE